MLKILTEETIVDGCYFSYVRNVDIVLYVKGSHI